MRLSSKNAIWFAFFSLYHRNKPNDKHPQLERKCMSVAVEGDSFLEETAFQHWVVNPVYINGSSFNLDLRKVNCIHNIRMAFLCKLCVQSPHQGSRAPYQDCRLLSPPRTNKQDPMPFMITHAHSAVSEFDERGSWGGVGVAVGVGEWGGGFLDWYLSTTYASNGLENWLSLICTNVKLSL